jgi:ETC complex I subunit conserved region
MGNLMTARIYSPAKNPLQSGRGKVGVWVLEHAPSGARTKDPLMGWTSSSDTNSQVKLKFPTKEAAIEYAQANNIDYVVTEAKEQKRIIRAYSDNFATNRKEPWSH